MNFFTRTKKIIALSLLITLIPSEARAWSFWQTIKENAGIVSFIVTGLALALLCCKSGSSATTKKPQPTIQQQNKPVAPRKSTQAATNARFILIPPMWIAHANQLSQYSKTIAEAVESLEKELKQLFTDLKNGSDKTYAQIDQFETQRAKIGAKGYNLLIRCNPIQQNFDERFNILISNSLGFDSRQAYFFLSYKSPDEGMAATLNEVKQKIQAKSIKPQVMDGLNKLFSCDYAKENFDAFLKGQSAFAPLEITDTVIEDRLKTLVGSIKELRITLEEMKAKKLPAIARFWPWRRNMPNKLKPTQRPKEEPKQIISDSQILTVDII